MQSSLEHSRSPARCSTSLGPGWSHLGDVHARGAAYFKGQYLDGEGIAHLLAKVASVEGWLATIERLNGSFAAVATFGTTTVAAVDRVRTFPLFYRDTAAGFRIGDDATALAGASGIANAELSSTVFLEFLLCGYVTGDETLCPSVRQVRAGHYLVWNASTGEHQVSAYYSFTHRDFLTDDEAGLVARLHAMHGEVFERLTTSTRGRQLVVPLSGGFDSRLIAVMLKELGASNVLCFSYGTLGSWEAEIARALAGHLGFEWHFVPYDAQLWRKLALEPSFAAYVQQAGNLACIPHAQDFPAMQHLVSSGRVSGDAVIVPGHTGDFLTGGHIPDVLMPPTGTSGSAVRNAIVSKHYSLWPWSRTARELRPRFEQRIRSVLDIPERVTREQAADAYERWEIQERQAKFICNSVRVYDFLRLDWRLPLYDHALMDFWCRVPVEQRFARRLYFAYVARHQNLPVAQANTDRNLLLSGAVSLLQSLGLKKVAKAARRRWRQINWPTEWQDCTHAPLAWLAAVDRDYFRQTYTGEETLHSYMAVRYLRTALLPATADALLAQTGYRRLIPRHPDRSSAL